MSDAFPLILLSIAALLVGLSKGGLPAIGMLAVPVLALVMSPIKAAALLLPVYVASDVVGVYLYRKKFSAPNLKILIPAGIVGVLIGWSTASVLSDRAIGVLIGLLGVGFCLKTWFVRTTAVKPATPNIGKGVFWGTLSGFTSFVSHAGGPPFQIYVLPQRLAKLEFAGTSTILFAVINAAKIIPYANLRPYAMADLRTAAAILPVALFGTVLGAYLTKRIGDAWFFRLVQIALFIVSLKLIIDNVT
jgi:uncharacterized protein